MISRLGPLLFLLAACVQVSEKTGLDLSAMHTNPSEGLSLQLPPRWTVQDTAYSLFEGGKYSTVERGETVFAYCNDVWRMWAVVSGAGR